MQKCLYCFMLGHGWLFQLPAAMVGWGQAGNWAAHVTQAVQGFKIRVLDTCLAAHLFLNVSIPTYSTYERFSD